MGKAYQCDRCGEVHRGSRAGSLNACSDTRVWDDITNGYTDGELCESCSAAYVEWWRAGRDEQPSQNQSDAPQWGSDSTEGGR